MPQLIQIREDFLANSRQYLTDTETNSLHCGCETFTCPSGASLTNQGKAGD